MTRHTDVLIVGAGPTGLTLTLLLRRLGVDCILVEKNAGRSTTSKALGLQYRVSELLSWLGLVEKFEACAAVQTKVQLYADGKTIATLVLDALPSCAGQDAFRPRPLILPQSETERLLGEALVDAGGRVEWGKELVDFTAGEERVSASLGDGEVIEARYLVGCEGAHSLARKRSNIDFAGKTFPHDFIMADVAIDTTLRHGQGHSWLHPDGIVSAISMPGQGRWRLFIEAGAFTASEVTLADVQRIYAERSGDTHSCISDPTWLTRFKIHSRLVDRFREGRVFLAGDAAHLHSPSGGQGITTGMQDAYNLGWKLAQVLRAGAPEALLDSYDEERRPAARAVLATTDGNTRIFFATGAVRKWLRNHVFMPLLGTRMVQRRLVAKLSQLGMNHRASSLSLGLRRRRLRAGDRAPDVILRSDTTRVALFELLRSARCVALLTQPDPALETRLSRLGVEVRVVEVEGDLRRLYGTVAGDLWIIRPDGYVGLCCALADTAGIDAYLARLWPAARVGATTSMPAKRWLTPHRLAQLGISVQFLALLRTLGEYFRLRSSLTIPVATPFVGGALLAASLAWVAVLCYFAGKDRAAAGVAGATVLALMAFKLVAF